MKKLLKRLKPNNDGAAMISVMIVSVFVIVLASTMLYFTSMNFQMKNTDYQNKQAFYKAERTLDIIKSILVIDVSNACETAYKAVMTRYAELDANSRQDLYAEKYAEALQNIWITRRDTNGDKIPDISGTEAFYNLVDAVADPSNVNGYLGVSDATKNEIKKCLEDGLAYDMSDGDGIDGIQFEYKPGDGQFIIKNVKILFTDGSYTSWLSTDIALVLPEYSVEIDKSAPGTSAGRETINMSDYVLYMNWKRE